MKILITGGTGTVGKALINQNDNEYISVSRNEEKIAELRLSQNKLTELCLQRYLPEMRAHIPVITN